MRAVESRYSAEHHMASVNLIFDDEQTAYLRELSEKMNLDFGEFIPHATLINVTEQDMPRLKLAAAALPSLDKLVLNGVNFLPDEAGNCVWVELRVQKTSWMVEVRRKLLEMLDDIHPGAGYRWIPSTHYDWVCRGWYTWRCRYERHSAPTAGYY